MAKIEELMQREIAKIVDRELNNPLLPEFITIHHVKVSKDLSQAVVQVTLLADADEASIEQTVGELNKSAGYINRLVSQRVKLRRHPQLKFVYTASTRYALEMEPVFQQIHEELEAADRRREEEGEGGAAEQPGEEREE